MAGDLTPLEAAVLDKLLSGDHPVLVALRTQLAGAKVTSRELSGVGFFTHLAPASDAVPAPVRTLRFGDVEATIVGLSHGAGFVLFVDDGLLTVLEGYCYHEPWPAEITTFALRYHEPERPKLDAELAPTSPSPSRIDPTARGG